MADACFLCHNNFTDQKIDINSETLYTNTKIHEMISKISKNNLEINACVCFSCAELINELDKAQKKCEEITSKLLFYLSVQTSDVEFYNKPEIFYCSENIKTKISDSVNCETRTITINSIENEKVLSRNQAVQSVNVITRKSENLNVYKCEHCGQNFETSSELKGHLATHNKLLTYVCEKCGQSYKHKSAFDVHMGMHEGIHPFICPHCNKSFTQKGALQRHIPIHTGECPFQCEQCGKRFIHHTSFKIHLISHTGKKDHKCSVCGMALMSASHLKRHMRIHTGERKFECTICSKRFAEKYNLAAHQKLVHPLNNENKNELSQHS